MGINGLVPTFAGDEEANALLKNDGLAFLLAVIADYSVPAERAWSLPYLLKQRLGHLSADTIADMNPFDLADVMKQKPVLHRFPTDVAVYIVAACRRLRTLGINASELWKEGQTSKQIATAFEGFTGVAQKKSSMATNILVRDMGVQVADYENMDVSYDVMVRRVFLRTGLVAKDTLPEVLSAARALNPSYPGALDLPAWYIGRNWCQPSAPRCGDCAIGVVCKKLTHLDASSV